ncbi:MAG: alpha/beta fold hydrolase [Candidatus Cloacimonadota bacterium]|nr:alpha/beta fold hydrolase [Candidatus Cloacimonadota bacterium]
MDLKKYHKPFAHNADSEIGVLLVHGLTSTTSAMRGMAERFAEKGFNVELPPLAGHGTKWQDLNKVTYHDWLDDLEKALSNLKERASKIFVFGLSLGGGLSLHLAGKHPELAGIIAINNVCKFTSPVYWFVPLIRFITPSVKGVASDIKDPNEKEIAYSKTPTNSVYEMLKMMKEMRKMLPSIKMPVLVFKSKEDHVIPIQSAKYTIDNLGSENKELIWLENSYHVAPLDFDKNVIFEKSMDFIKSLENDSYAKLQSE